MACGERIGLQCSKEGDWKRSAREEMRGRPKLDSVITGLKDCLERTLMTEQYVGEYHRTSKSHKSGTKMVANIYK